ncbi:filamentous hemagglutinin N-terminal domain-containing protein [Caballeronia sp. EK]|uniref:two-partner secretion domain-containing protein n=1 Tax=Caballeronia sp. EK TaxID=2767469 RepID=UPI001655245C|nr:filamentous hemagglutinin N-terminal domain-containing protein [Caballeronia sp. EK]MBC8635304.1 filamentous hemagglutinin N-terminal domain-containing protein [Caballeronia sp. EK]
MSDDISLRTRRHRREWERAIRRLARRAARHAGIDVKPAALLPLIALVAAPGVFALPGGGQVVTGNVSISQPDPHTMTITQGMQKGIVNWNSFSIGGNETVNIAQPSPQAVLLNRVTGGEASNIAGHLNANGRVFLVNPAGVLFTRGASVNVGSIVASTLGISDSDFLAGKYRFTSAQNAGGLVRNEGTITANERGTVALLGAQVDNSGTVSAKLGTVAMGAGSDITLDFAGDGLTMLKIDGPAAQALASNSGVLQADGGQVMMSVQTADALASTVLNQTGTVRARSVAERNGRIVLDGGNAGLTQVAGSVDATGGAGLAGGNIDITGYHVELKSPVFDDEGKLLQQGATIDASGGAGGGRVRVGGGSAGKETDIHNADAVWMGPGAQIHADALDSGDGGNVVVYGANAARVYGTLTARGGNVAGNGGLIETSGRFLDVAGANIDASALHGIGGTWLLDPYDLTITSTSIDSGGGPNFSASSDLSTISVGTINNRLNAGTSVTINTGTGGTQSGDITLQGMIDKFQGNAATLTLLAARSIIIDSTAEGSGGAGIISSQASTAPASPLSVVLTANTAGHTDGTAQVLLRGSEGNAPLQFFTNGGDVTIGGQAGGVAPRVVVDNVNMDTRTRTDTLSGDGAVQIGTDAPSGRISINGSAPVDAVGDARGLGYGVNVEGGSTLQTTTGAIALTGDGVTGGVKVGGSAGNSTRASSITSTAGEISLNGTGSSAGTGVILTGANLSSGGGAISVTGTGGTGGASTGVAMSGGSLSTTTGNVTLTGNSSTGVGVAINGATLDATGGGAITVSGTGSSQGVALSDGALRSATGNLSVIGNSAAGNAVSISDATLSTSAGAISVTGTGLAGGVTLSSTDVGSVTGNVTIDGTSADGIGVALGQATLTSRSGAFSLTGHGGAGGVSAQSGSIEPGSGNVTIDGTALASGSVARADGVSLSVMPITTTGGITIRGHAALDGPLGGGVTIEGAGEGNITLRSGLPGIRVYGSGNGYEGVSTSAGGVDSGRGVFFVASNGNGTGGPIDIRGVTNGTEITASGADARFHSGVKLVNASLDGSDITLAGSISGGATVELAGLQIIDSSVGSTATKTLTLRASNTAANTSSIAFDTGSTSLDARSTLAAPHGTLVLAPGSVSATAFDIAADDAAPISIGVTGATGRGFTIDSTLGTRFTTSVDNIYIGSASHTGHIAVGATCAAAPCAGLPTFGNLSVANGGAGSQGISLLSGISLGGKLTLDSAGPVTQAAPIGAVGLLLTGPGTFTLTNANNVFGPVTLVGTGNTSLSGTSLTLDSGSGTEFDAATNAFRTIDGTTRSTLAGNLTLTSTTGDIEIGTPLQNASGHDITLDLHSADSVTIGSNITSTLGALNLVADALNEVFVGGFASGDGTASRVAIQTNGGNVTLTGHGATVTTSDGPTSTTGAGVVLRLADIDTRTGAANDTPTSTGGAVTIHGTMPAPAGAAGSFLGTRAGIEVNDATIATGSGDVTLIGQSLNPGVNPGGGVVLGDAAQFKSGPGGPARITTGTGAIRIYGTGSGPGYAGVTVTDGASITSAGGLIDIRGSSASVYDITGASASSPTYGVLLLNGSINASAPSGTVSIAGSTPSADAGIAYGAVPLPGFPPLTAGPFSITTGEGGVISLRASNNGTATSLLGRVGAGSIDPKGGTLAISAASVDPSSFNVTALNGVPITLFGTSATPGLSIDNATYQTFSTSLQTLVLGSPTQTGRITVAGPCAGGAGCATRPAVATSLTLENTGAGSQGIDLPSGIALPANATLALDTTGTVSDPGGVQTGTLVLAGGGVFNLLDPNDVGTLVIAGAGTVNFRNAGSFTIGTGRANGVDANGRVVPIGGQPGTLTGNLVAISDNGQVTLGAPNAPLNLQAGGSIDLVMENAFFANPYGSTLGAGNAWRVWAMTWQGENRNGIDPRGPLPNFYGCVYGGVCGWNGRQSMDVVSGNGNHFVYTQRPAITVDIGNQDRYAGQDNQPFSYSSGQRFLSGDQQGNVLAGSMSSPANRNSAPGTYAINGTFSSAVGYDVTVVPGTLTVMAPPPPPPPPPPPLEGAVFNRTGLQPLFTAQEQSFVYESNLGGVNVCVGTSEPILALQQSEGPADSLASEWKRVRSRPNLNNCLVVNGQHGCGEF